MRKVLTMASVAVVLTLGWSVSTPERAVAAEASSVCQFYRGEPLCKTVEETNCFGADAGIEARTCRKTTEYWYWS